MHMCVCAHACTPCVGAMCTSAHGSQNMASVSLVLELYAVVS